MNRKFKAIPGKGIVASTSNSTERIVASFNYDVGAEDPEFWYIDYDEFFETVEKAIRELGLKIIDVEERYSRGGKSREYKLSNGIVFNSYELETDILWAHADDGLDYEDQIDFIKDYIKELD